MKKYFLSLVVFIGLFFNLFSQDDCMVLNPSPPVYVIGQKASFTSYTFKVYYHIIRKNNGKKASTDVFEIAAAHNYLNSQFISSNICFVWSGTDYIDNTGLYNSDYQPSIIEYVFQQNAHTDGIDVYIIHDNNLAFNGVVNSLPGNAMLLVNSKMQTSTFPHEMGHILGLYHTHEESICVEAIDGSNSTICGDLVEDTPANSSSCSALTATCQYPCTVNYDITPLLNNYMIWTQNLTCRTTFTQGQTARMHGVIDVTNDLQARLIPLNRTITNLFVPFNVPFSMITEIVQEAKGVLIVNNVDIMNGGKGAFRAEDEVILQPGFDALEGSRALVIIENICKPNETQAKNVDDIIDYYENDGYRIDLSNSDLAGAFEHSVLVTNDESNLLFFPNPFKDVMNISIESDVMVDRNEQVKVVFHDLTGKSVLHKSFSYLELYDGLEIETSSLSDGAYILHVVYADQIFTSRVIKQ